MTVTPIFRSIRDPIGSAARWAVRSVPAHLAARGLAVPVWAALLLPAIALLPLASPWASYILAPVFALAAGLRLAALVDLFLPKPKEPPPLGALLPMGGAPAGPLRPRARPCPLAQDRPRRGGAGRDCGLFALCSCQASSFQRSFTCSGPTCGTPACDKLKGLYFSAD